jgi:hypothetical protein
LIITYDELSTFAWGKKVFYRVAVKPMGDVDGFGESGGVGVRGG